MGFTIETRSGPVVAIRAGKNDRTPVFVDVAALTGKKGSERANFLKEEADRNAVSDKVGKPLAAAVDVAGVVAALRPIVDERGSPGGQVAPSGTPLLQPTDERRRTGSHYTPRSLTEPIVRHALEPAFERLGLDATPEQILDVKICDPAMGSGAFLVEACRALAGRLVKAWDCWPMTRPTIPPDEDAELHAKRLVAQRCLHGVDKNPLATDLAKLSLWLATLARDHEFTFLDHALKSGDSLVGLTRGQIAAAHWDASKPGLPLFRQLVQQRVAEAMKGRAEIHAAPDDTARAIQEARHRSLEQGIKGVCAIGDAVIAAFFAEKKPQDREKLRVRVESWLTGSLGADLDKVADFALSLKKGPHPCTPFHWEIEFPEVFARGNGGFDAIVGNPPFLGGMKISPVFGQGYLTYLYDATPGAGSRCDLVAYFFRRSFMLLRTGGALGLVGTNTIAQGDTRTGGLEWLASHDGHIYAVTRRLKWPGEAAVVVAIVHIAKSVKPARCALNNQTVSKITPFLLAIGGGASPARLAGNSDKCFIGNNLLGMGFTFDDQSSAATPISVMRDIIAKFPECAKLIFPFIGGDELATSPSQQHRRYVINFGNMDLEEARVYQPLFRIVEARVLPDRKDKKGAYAKKWWQFGRRNVAGQIALQRVERAIVSCQVSPFISWAFQDANVIFAHTLSIVAIETHAAFCALQARVHELWARFFASSMKDDLRYTPSGCFETFPFPINWEHNAALEAIGKPYWDFRAALMIERNEGMTKTYKRFHDRTEIDKDIMRLRELHADMDRAMLRAYGWDDLAARAAPIFLDEANEDDHTYQGRLFWPSDFRDEVLARLLALNAARHAEEVSLGIAPGMKGKKRDDEETEVEDVD
jgi:hypothetical protein